MEVDEMMVVVGGNYAVWCEEVAAVKGRGKTAHGVCASCIEVSAGNLKTKYVAHLPLNAVDFDFEGMRRKEEEEVETVLWMDQKSSTEENPMAMTVVVKAAMIEMGKSRVLLKEIPVVIVMDCPPVILMERIQAVNM
jgi:hypothetical protein